LCRLAVDTGIPVTSAQEVQATIKTVRQALACRSFGDKLKKFVGHLFQTALVPGVFVA
jgi:hypothetical protein